MLLATPIVVVFSSVFFTAGDIWTHLLDTVLTRYARNSLLLVAGVSVGVLALGHTIPRGSSLSIGSPAAKCSNGHCCSRWLFLRT